MDYFAALLAGVEGLRPRLSAISEVADQVAGRLAADGRLLLASVRPDFTSEGFIRSGGLMLAEEWTPGTVLSPNDVVILGWSGALPDQELELLRDLRASGALIVGIGPASWGGADSQMGADLFLESEISLSEAATAPFGGEGYPLISLQNLVVLWTFTGEIVAALTRVGRMPDHVSECASGRGEGSQCPVCWLAVPPGTPSAGDAFRTGEWGLLGRNRRDSARSDRGGGRSD